MSKKVNDEEILELVKEGLYQTKMARVLRMSKRGVGKRLKKLEKKGKIKRTSKNPAFYVLRLGVNPSMYGKHRSIEFDPNKHRNLIHSTHRIKFSISYKGTQPFNGAVIKSFGRYKTAKQSIYKLSDKITIVAFKNKINVWVHKPKGKLTQNQLINAKRDGYLALVGFAKAFSLTIEDSLEKVLRSHHVVEDKRVNAVFKPVFEQFEEEIEARIGSKVCKTSHKGKIEHEGKKREDRVILGSDVAKGVEKLILEVPQRIENIECIEGKYGHALELYNEQIRKHLNLIDQIGITLKKMEKKL